MIKREEIIGDCRLLLGANARGAVLRGRRGSLPQGSQCDCLPCHRCDGGRSHRAPISAQGGFPSARGVRASGGLARELSNSRLHIRSRHGISPLDSGGGLGQSFSAPPSAGNRSFGRDPALGNGTVHHAPPRNRTDSAKGGRAFPLMPSFRRGPQLGAAQTAVLSGQGSNKPDRSVRCA